MARCYYDKYLGTVVSADTLIPDPTDIASYHRYMYAAGDPIKYNDPTGHDPFEDEEWLAKFDGGDVINAKPEDIILRLYEVAFPDQWNQDSFYNSEGDYIEGSIPGFLKKPWRTGITWDDIPGALENMAGWYTNGETQGIFAQRRGKVH